MKIVVCIKQVPDTTEVRINPETGTLIREGVPSIINPDDKSGLEVALKLKEELGAKVVVLTMGPPQAEEALREAFAMGADEGILLTDRAFSGADTWSTSYTLAMALKKIEYDLIITGRQAIDGDTAQVGPQIAEHLKLTHISYVEDVKVAGEYLIVKKVFEDRYHKIKVKLPCLITVLAEMNKPRYMSVEGVLVAYREKDITVWTANDIEVERGKYGLVGSPTKVKRSFTRGVKMPGKLYQVDGKEAALVIIEKIKENFII